MSSPLEKIGSILLLIIVGVVILYVLLFPGGLYSKAIEKTKPWADNVYKLMHKEKEEKNEQEIPKEIEDMFNNLIDDLNKDTPSNNCLLTHIPFVKDFDNYYIKFSNSKDETYAYLYKENALFFGPEKIKKKVCVVDAKNFYDNYLDKTPCTTDCKINYREIGEIRITDKETIFFNGEKYDLDDLNLMFKADNEHICFFPTKLGNGICDADEFVLDSECIKELNVGKYKDIKNCEEDTLMFYNGAFYGLKKDWVYENVPAFKRRGNEIYKYIGVDKRVAYIYREGIDTRDFELITKGPYDKILNGKGVYYTPIVSGRMEFDKKGNYYGLKEDWEKIGTKWKYQGNEKVPEEFKTKGIFNYEYEEVFGPPKIE